MDAIRRMLAMAGGGLVGAAVGAAVTALLTPKRGEEVERDIRARIDDARRAREAAEAETARRLTAEFRASVHDPNALQPEPDIEPVG